MRLSAFHMNHRRLAAFHEKLTESFHHPENTFLRRLLVPLMIERAVLLVMGLGQHGAGGSDGGNRDFRRVAGRRFQYPVQQLFFAFATSGTIVISRLLGAKRTDAAQQAVKQLYMVTVAASFLLSIMSFLFRHSLMSLLYGAVSPEISQNALILLIYYALTAPLEAVRAVGGAVFRSTQNARISTLLAVAGAAAVCPIAPAVGRSFGAKDAALTVRYVKKLSIFCIAAITVTHFAFFPLFPLVSSAYRLSTETARFLGLRFLIATLPAILTYPFTFMLAPALRALKQNLYVLLVAVSSLIVFRIGAGYVFCVILGLGTIGQGITMVCDWVARGLFLA